MRRAILLVLDGVGIGGAHDAAAYGDQGSNTLGNIASITPGFTLPALEAMGLGTLTRIQGLGAWMGDAARCAAQPKSAGKDSTTGHWELCGLVIEKPFPTYPNGFPAEVVEKFAYLTNRPVIGNVAASGTAIIDRYAEEHEATGAWILYTSADSVFQVAAHEKVIPLQELYRGCQIAREMLVAPHNVSRVIARPYVGVKGAYQRTSGRKDYSVAPPGETLLDALESAGIRRFGIGKVDDLFAGRGITSQHTGNNADGIRKMRIWLREQPSGLLFANLVDFDQLYGHRNDTPGFYVALRQIDNVLPEFLSLLREDDLLFLTADHGNDPTTPSTDHSRERVPVLVAGPRVKPLKIEERSTFADVGATIAEWFDIPFRGAGRSFLREVVR